MGASNVVEFKPVRDVREGGRINVNADVILDFENLRILREQESALDISMPDVAAGEIVLTVLTAYEAKLFVEMVTLEDDIDTIHRETLARRMELSANLLRNAESVPDPNAFYLSKDESHEYHRLSALRDYVSGLFWYNVRARTNSFNTVLRIRAGLKVVISGYKYADESR